MSRKTNDIKKRPKKGLKIVCSVIGCAFALLSVLTPFAGLKMDSVSADTSTSGSILPPADLGKSYISRYGLGEFSFLYHFDTLVNGEFESDTIGLSYSLPRVYKGGMGVNIYRDLTLSSVEYGIPTHGKFTLSDTNMYVAFGSDLSLETGGEFRFEYYVNGPIFVNESIFNLLFRSWAVSSYAFVDDLNFICSFDILDIDNSYLSDRGETVNYSWTNFSKSWTRNANSGDSYFISNFSTLSSLDNVTCIDDLICIKNFTYSFYGVSSGSGVGISFPVRVDLEGAIFDVVQRRGFESFHPLIEEYVKVPVDDIGLGVITQSVSEFFNVEFVPGFKLWYFLLIGLGCAIVGIGLKFFFGG